MTAPAFRAARPLAALLPALVLLALVPAPARLHAASASDAKPPKLGPGQTGAALSPVGGRSPWGAVASDTEAASKVAAAVLAAGGNAIDAAVAGAFAAGAASPGSSGVGGQAWMIVHTANGEDVAFLSPLRAPPRVNPARAKAAKRDQVMTGPLAPTAPGMVATLARAHARLGTRPWSELVTPAVAIAEAGYLLGESERLFLLLYRDRIEASPSLRPLYMTGSCDDGALAVPFPVGHRVTLPDLARTLRRLAEAGPDDFYRGAIAAEIASDFSRHSAFLGASDLARIPASIVETVPLRGRYRDLGVLSLPLPGGGGLVLETLHVLQSLPSDVLAAEAWARSQAIVESVRIAFADGQWAGSGQEVGDGPETSAWLRPARGAELGQLIRLGQALPRELLPAKAAQAFSDRDTTHLSVVDREGNAVALTMSLGRTWGSTHVTPGLGFPYNAFLEGFDVERPGSASYLRPGAPLSTAVAPTILLRDGRAVLVLGAAGSSKIPSAIANVVVGVVDGNLGVAEAVAASRAIWSEGRRNRGVRLEVAPPLTPEDVDFLQASGYDDLEAYAPGPDTSNFCALNAVAWNAAAGAWEAGADPRRQGAVAVPAREPPAGGARRVVQP